MEGGDPEIAICETDEMGFRSKSKKNQILNTIIILILISMIIVQL